MHVLDKTHSQSPSPPWKLLATPSRYPQAAIAHAELGCPSEGETEAASTSVGGKEPLWKEAQEMMHSHEKLKWVRASSFQL